MEPGYSALRNLLLIVLVLVALAVMSNFYVASHLSRNSDELASIRLLLQKQMMGDAMTDVMTQSKELQKRMDALNQAAGGIDAKLKKAQDDFVARMNVELPRIMDNYIKSRTPAIGRQAQKELQKHGVPVPQRRNERLQVWKPASPDAKRPASASAFVSDFHPEELFA